ncbi:MAG: TIM barrel protein [Candidatus Latescibacteria bacterium]|jgi:hydroxypyruvate isomerase|nr:TIM barrel protein [Candidatus Latescibacterota bacterium]
MGINQSVCFGCFTRGNASPKDVITQASQIGYSSVEMLPQEHWSLVHDNGMEIAIIVGHGSLPDGLNKKENHTRIEDELLANIDLAVANNIPSLITFSGNREGKSDDEGRDNCIEGLLRVSSAAEKAGITLCMELLNSKVNHPDYQCDFTPWGVDVCKGVNSPRVKLLYDIYHMQIMEGDLIRNITDYSDYIGHYHTAGNPGRNDLDDEQEIYYPPVMRAIAKSGYEGYVGHEFVPKADPLEAMNAAYGTCDV